MPLDFPLLARRARLVAGMKQEAFAELFGVDVSTISRWERSKLRPSADILLRMREMVVRSQSILSEEAVEASYVYKYVSKIGDLTHPVTISKGVAEALLEHGVTPEQLTEGLWTEFSRLHPQYNISVVRALEIIQKDWLSGKIAYAEAHCWSIMTTQWVQLIVAPMPDLKTAIVEGVPIHEREQRSFHVQLVPIRALIHSS
jgi:transcriptional regulator with XRE-family HTH domain